MHLTEKAKTKYFRWISNLSSPIFYPRSLPDPTKLLVSVVVFGWRSSGGFDWSSWALNTWFFSGH